MRLWRRYRLPRARTETRVLVRRRRDGRIFMAHHLGLASSIVQLVQGTGNFWFIPVRRWRRRWVSAIDVGWAPASGAEFDVLRYSKRQVVTCVGRKAAMRIEDGGLGRLS